MKNFFSFFAFAAIIFSFAACGGNEPEAASFQIKVNALSEITQLVVTPARSNAAYIAWVSLKSEVGNTDLRQFAAEHVGQYQYDIQQTYEHIKLGKKSIPVTTSAETEYIAFACYVKEGEGGETLIDGEIKTEEFSTLQKNTLNGKFTVNNQGRKVRFYESNLLVTVDAHDYYSSQWTYYGNSEIGSMRDLFPWSAVDSRRASVLSAEEWWYLLHDRNNGHGDQLFTLAKVNGVRGLIILPDDWNAPDNVYLKTAAELEMVWDEENQEYKNSTEGFDGFEMNRFSGDIWNDIEFAGAVFLPAAITSNTVGCYWSNSTMSATMAQYAHSFYFAKDHLGLETLRESCMKKSFKYSIRQVVE